MNFLQQQPICKMYEEKVSWYSKATIDSVFHWKWMELLLIWILLDIKIQLSHRAWLNLKLIQANLLEINISQLYIIEVNLQWVAKINKRNMLINFIKKPQVDSHALLNLRWKLLLNSFLIIDLSKMQRKQRIIT